MISPDRTADQSHEYLSCNDFFGQGSTSSRGEHHTDQLGHRGEAAGQLDLCGLLLLLLRETHAQQMDENELGHEDLSAVNYPLVFFRAWTGCHQNASLHILVFLTEHWEKNSCGLRQTTFVQQCFMISGFEEQQLRGQLSEK